MYRNIFATQWRSYGIVALPDHLGEGYIIAGIVFAIWGLNVFSVGDVCVMWDRMVSVARNPTE